jgi:hypothetical protein
VRSFAFFFASSTRAAASAGDSPAAEPRMPATGFVPAPYKASLTSTGGALSSASWWMLILISVKMGHCWGTYSILHICNNFLHICNLGDGDLVVIRRECRCKLNFLILQLELGAVDGRFELLHSFVSQALIDMRLLIRCFFIALIFRSGYRCKF